jgi:hypothetical protein
MDKPTWDDVIKTYEWLISKRENLPDITLEDVLPNCALNSIKQECEMIKNFVKNQVGVNND